jgi:hypothetical protein
MSIIRMARGLQIQREIDFLDLQKTFSVYPLKQDETIEEKAEYLALAEWAGKVLGFSFLWEDDEEGMTQANNYYPPQIQPTEVLQCHLYRNGEPTGFFIDNVLPEMHKRLVEAEIALKAIANIWDNNRHLGFYVHGEFEHTYCFGPEEGFAFFLTDDWRLFRGKDKDCLEFFGVAPDLLVSTVKTQLELGGFRETKSVMQWREFSDPMCKDALTDVYYLLK